MTLICKWKTHGIVKFRVTFGPAGIKWKRNTWNNLTAKWFGYELQNMNCGWHWGKIRMCSLLVLPCFLWPAISTECLLEARRVPGAGWGWGGRDAAAVCWLLEDNTSPSHLLITVVSETQPANNCPLLQQAGDSTEHEQMEGERNVSASQPAGADRAQLGLFLPSG